VDELAVDKRLIVEMVSVVVMAKRTESLKDKFDRELMEPILDVNLYKL
jgi:hypothetical protein